MINVNQEYNREIECEYKNERYKVRDNGAIMRMAREGKPKRPKDELWTFGETIDRGYATFCGERVHIIVATAFHGELPTKQYVVDHMDTNRQNNRPENLRWLTKLENILLNPITKAKIEYLCGSIENFLEDPSQLNGHENDDANFAWMRAVSPEEAKNTLANWEKIISKPRTEFKSSGKPIEEWIFQQSHPKKDELDFLTEFTPTTPVAPSKPEKEIEEPVSIIEPPIVTQSKQKQPAITKTEFTKAILEICKNEGWEYEKRYKTDKWTADILIKAENKRFAFSVYKSPIEASEILPLMEKDGVKGYGLLLSSKWVSSKDVACFNTHRYGDAIDVIIGAQNLRLNFFLKSALENRIEHRTKTKITAIDVIFAEFECWSCHEKHHIPYVRYLVDENGKRISDDDDYVSEEDCSNAPDLCFGADYLEVVRHYIAEHPEKGIAMGEVKERYSKTRDESYMSYGCPKCDALVGDWFLKDMAVDLMYATDESLMNRIQLKEPFETSVNEWIVRE